MKRQGLLLVLMLISISFFALTGYGESGTFEITEQTLPVELSSFTATQSGMNSVRLLWVTQSETNVYGFKIYKSNQEELSQAQMLNVLIDATNTSQMQVYVYVDEEIYSSGIYYYWLEVIDVNGYSLIRDLLPGEAIVIEDNKVEKRVLCPKGRAHCMFEWVYFSRPDSVIEGKSVYEARIELGRNIEFEGEGDVVIPVPDTARTAALGFSEKYGIKHREGLIKNRYVGRTFIMPSQVSRDIAVRDKLNVIKGEIRGKKVILVDDSIVRGTTSRRIVSMLRSNGAKEVHMVSTCPPIKHPCYYGIDMPTESELIAATDTDIVAEKIGADSVTYQTIKGLIKAIGLKKEDLCLACLNGDYPTHIPEEVRKGLTRAREYEREADCKVGVI